LCEIQTRLAEFEKYRWHDPDGITGSKVRQYRRLELEKIAINHERKKHDRSEDELDLSRRHWAGDRSGWSALRNQVSSVVKKRVSKLGEYVKRALEDGRGSGQASSPKPMLPMTSDQASP